MSDARRSSRSGPRSDRGRARGRSRGRPRGAEPQAVQRLSGTHCVREALAARRRDLLRLWVDGAARRGEVAELCERAEQLGVPVSQIEAEALLEKLDAPARRSNPQGVVLEAGPLPEYGLDELLERRREPDACVVVLDGVEDPQNVGALARVAEAAGAGGLVLTARRAPPLGPALARASAGAIEWLPVARVPNLGRALDRLRDAGVWIVGADPQAPTDLFAVPDAILTGPLALVLGAEGRGLRAGVAQRVDHPLAIPMRGHVGSLNVATAGAVVLFELLRRRSRSSVG